MHVLVMLDYLIAAQNNQVAALVDLACPFHHGGRKPVIAFVWRGLQELVQGRKTKFAMLLLAADLLEAEDVCVEPD